jgi:hypothetical protein
MIREKLKGIEHTSREIYAEEAADPLSPVGFTEQRYGQAA